MKTKSNSKSLVAYLSILLMFSYSCYSQDKEQIKATVDSKKGELIEVGNPIVSYSIPYLNDHSVVYNPTDKRWHMYGIISDQRYFIHLVADSLTQSPWKREEDFCVGDCEKEIWAPHILQYQNTWYMFYTMIGEPREIRYAVSNDLYNWTHPASNPLLALTNSLSDNLKNKDPMVFRHDDKWVMYYSVMKDEKHWVVGYSTSKDLVNWSEPGICFDEHTDSPGVESPFVVKRGAYYYLFLSARPWPIGGVDIFRSKTPYLWKSSDQVKRIDPWHAPEVLRDLDGKWYLTLSSGLYEKDFMIAPMYWNDELDDETSSMPIPCCK